MSQKIIWTVVVIVIAIVGYFVFFGGGSSSEAEEPETAEAGPSIEERVDSLENQAAGLRRDVNHLYDNPDLGLDEAERVLAQGITAQHFQAVRATLAAVDLIDDKLDEQMETARVAAEQAAARETKAATAAREQAATHDKAAKAESDRVAILASMAKKLAPPQPAPAASPGG
jgi:flagellar basal body-associated protein FliL